MTNNETHDKMPPSRSEKLKQLRALSRLLDSAIPLPGGYRIGVDGFLGLIPGIGDLAGGVASSYIIIESAKLGAHTTTLLRMVFNVLLESFVGCIPLFGDVFDFAWKANEKNMDLMEKQLAGPLPQSSHETRLGAAAVIIILLLLVGILFFVWLGVMIILRIIEALHGGIV